MTTQIYIRRKTIINTDYQRRCYNGCNYSQRIEYGEWELFQEWDTHEFAQRVVNSLKCERNEFKLIDLV